MILLPILVQNPGIPLVRSMCRFLTSFSLHHTVFCLLVSLAWSQLAEGAQGAGIDQAVSFQFGAGSLSGPESAGTVCGSVVRSGPTNDSYTVAWRILPGTAQPGTDFAGPLTGSLTVPGGQIFTCLPIQFLNDGVIEPTESFTLQLVSASGQATIGSFSNFVFEIRDNDRGIEFSAAEFKVLETETQAVVTVYRGDDGSNPLTVRYETFINSATAGLDYEPQSGTLSFPHGLMNATFPIPLRDDCLLEPDEFVGVRLVSSETGAVVGSLSNGLVRIVDAGLERPGSRDPAFNPLTRGGEVLVARADGRILVGGNILAYMAVPLPLVMQLLPNGNADPSFNPLLFSETLLGSFLAEISAMAVDASGRVLVAGFRLQPRPDGSLSGTTNFLVRLLPNGAVDLTFRTRVQTTANSLSGAIVAMAVQSDGKILIGGDIQSINDDRITGLARLHPDGSRDFGFVDARMTNVAPSARTRLTSLHLMPDGRIVVGGSFTHVEGSRREGVARFQANGLLDPSFDSGCALCDILAPESQTVVESMAVDGNGSLWIAGSFTNIGMETQRGLARLSPTGDIDRSLNLGSGANNGLGAANYRNVALQSDGKVLVSGSFTNFSGVVADGLVRLNRDGSVDQAFKPGMSIRAGQWFNSLLVQPDGHILLSHDVSALARFYGEDVLVAYVARLYGEPVLTLEARIDPIFLAPEIQVNARPGAAYRLEKSADLRQWIPIGTNLATECSVNFYPTFNPPENGSVFYRAVRLGL